MGVVVHFLHGNSYRVRSGSATKLHFPGLDKQLLLSDPFYPQHLPQQIECISRYYVFLNKCEHYLLAGTPALRRRICSSWCRCRKAGQRSCSRQWNMFYTTASQFSFSVIVRSWPENWPIFTGITLVPSWRENARCVLSNDEYKDHSALISIKNPVIFNQRRLHSAEHCWHYAKNKLSEYRCAKYELRAIWNKWSYSTHPSFVVALANTKRPPNSTEFRSSHQTTHSPELELAVEAQRTSLRP